jgi:hypothetical protein
MSRESQINWKGRRPCDIFILHPLGEKSIDEVNRSSDQYQSRPGSSSYLLLSKLITDYGGLRRLTFSLLSYKKGF